MAEMTEDKLKGALTAVQKQMNKMKAALQIKTIKIPKGSTIKEIHDIIGASISLIPAEVVAQIKDPNGPDDLKAFGQGYNQVALAVKAFLAADKAEPEPDAFGDAGDAGDAGDDAGKKTEDPPTGRTAEPETEPPPKKTRKAPVEVKLSPDDIIMDLFKMLNPKQIAEVKAKHQTYILQLMSKK